MATAALTAAHAATAAAMAARRIVMNRSSKWRLADLIPSEDPLDASQCFVRGSSFPCVFQADLSTGCMYCY